ncbi:MAG: hypothetical protein AAFX79_09380 [Planctomycetota bacterium]
MTAVPHAGGIDPPPHAADAMDLLVDGTHFVLVRRHGVVRERIMIGGVADPDDPDAPPPGLALTAHRDRRLAQQFAVGMLATATALMGIAAVTHLGRFHPPLAALTLVAAVFACIAMVAALRPRWAMHLLDPLPGADDRPPLLAIEERTARARTFELFDEERNPLGLVRRRMGRWRLLRGEGAPEITARIARKRMHAGAVVAVLLPGPIGVMLALRAPWSGIEFLEGKTPIAHATRIDAEHAMALHIVPGHVGDIDRRHLLALACLVLSMEANR